MMLENAIGVLGLVFHITIFLFVITIVTISVWKLFEVLGEFAFELFNALFGAYIGTAATILTWCFGVATCFVTLIAMITIFF
jgi:hypothetical protein